MLNTCASVVHCAKTILFLSENNFSEVLIATQFWLGIVTFITLFFRAAPYGKLSTSNRDQQQSKGNERRDLMQQLIEFCSLPGKWAWCFQESPSFLMYGVTFLSAVYGKQGFDPNWRHWLYFALFQFHYIHRAIIYTWFRCVSMSDSTLLITLCGFMFCCTNGYLNAHYAIESADQGGAIGGYGDVVRIVVGLFLFFYGFYINYTSDEILFNLRRTRSTEREVARDHAREKYKIPRGGYFELVTCANYFGEMIEWMGYAVLTGHCAAIVFAIWTPLNLLPRALSQHKWYHEKFGSSYPKNRKAIIPYLL